MKHAVESPDSAPLAKTVLISGTPNRKSKKHSKKLQQQNSFKYWKSGTINVRTLRTDVKAYETVLSIDKAGLQLTGIQKVERLGYGKTDIQLPNNNQYKFIWNGIKRQEGVGVIIKKSSFIKLTDFETISPRS